MSGKKINKEAKFASKIKQRKYTSNDLPIEEHILNFDVLYSTAEQARELVAWLQLELIAMRNIQK